jgi:beta-galactosidase
VKASLVFEIVVPQGAEVVGTYEADFYAGTPAVTRNAFGAGYGWYVATALDADGVAWVVRQVLALHGVELRYTDVPGLESAVRVAPDGTRLLFLLNHTDQPVVATGPGGSVRLEPRDVVVVREPPR